MRIAVNDKKSDKKSKEPFVVSLDEASQAALTELLERVKQTLAGGQGSEAILEILASQPPGRLAWDLALIDQLARIPHPALPEALLGYFGPGLEKIRYKALKKAFHAWKSRQVPVPALHPPKDTTPIRLPDTEPSEGYLSIIDGAGSRMVVLHLAKTGIDFNVVHALINDQQGLKDLFSLSLSKKRRRELLAEYSQQEVGQLVSVPPAYALKLIEEAYSHTTDQNLEGPAIYRRVREQLLARIDLSTAPELEDLLPKLEDSEIEAYLLKSQELILDDAFQRWMAAPEDLAPWLQKVHEVYDSPLVLSEDQTKNRVDAVIDQAVSDLFPLDQRPLLSRRLLEMAYFLDRSGRPEIARQAQATGIDLLRRRVALQGESPFLLGLVLHPMSTIVNYLNELREAAEQSEVITAPSESLITTK
ncbi:MAG: hypothetical protein DRG58_03345 [Deltaproteobacteria bacterium]|nr:MAG: hypothetical protein DRG58_03345 [Deltaproteobacteria bacterium]